MTVKAWEIILGDFSMTGCSDRQMIKFAGRLLSAHLLLFCVMFGRISASASPLPPPPAGPTLVTFQVQDQSGVSGTNVPVTFGQPFKLGDVPSGSTLAARLSGSGTAIPLQVDAKSTNADGSLRHAILTTRIPNLAARGTQTIELFVTPSSASSAPVALADLLATNFDAAVSLSVSGAVYQASAKQLLQASSSPRTWLSGPVTTEWLISTPLKTYSGLTHPHLAVNFAIRAYNGMDSVRVDISIENNTAFVATPQNYTYDATVTVGGNTAYTKSALNHYAQSRWRKVFWWAKDPGAVVKLNTAYLLGTPAVPNYDPSIVVPESALSTMSWAIPTTDPMQSGPVVQYMPTTGSRPDIGPLPQWGARYILTMDPRARAVTLGVGDLAGSWPIHYPDEATGLPVSLDTHPNITLQSVSGYENFPACGGSCATPYTPDSAHQPELAYLPFLVTGDFYYLEELHFWANWNMIQWSPNYRGFAKGLINFDQLRGQAWSLRTLADAAYITPDSHPMKQYFMTRVQNNVSNYVNEIPSQPTLGFIGDGFAIINNTTMAPWEDDFFTFTAGRLVEMGFSSAQPLRDWKTKFIWGRFSNEPTFCRFDATNYLYTVIDPSGGGYISTWARLMLVNDPAHVGNCPAGFDSYMSDSESWTAEAMPALTTAYAAGNTGALAQLNYVRQQTSAAGADYNSDPTWAMMPRSVSSTPPDTTPPTVSISSPVSGATVSGTISVTANASDNVGVVGVQFKLDGNNLGTEVIAAPYSVSWNTTTATNASHTLSAAARDAAGNIGSAANVSVTVSNQPPSVGLSPASVNFGNQSVGNSSVAQGITLSNTGGPLSITSIAIAGTNAGDFSQTNTCGASVAGGASCTINVTFKPTAAGSRVASVTITDNAAGSTQTVALSGTGVATPPTVSLSASSVSFGTQSVGSASAAQTVTLSNSGGSPLAIASIGVTGTNAGDFQQGNTCGASVAGGGSCTISVTFKPTAAGSRAGAVTITDNAAGSPRGVGINGTGIVSTVSLSSSSLSFSGQMVGSTSSSQAVTLTNSGSGALSISSLVLGGANSGDFSKADTCGASVAAGGSCAINVTFKPTVGGSRTGAVMITDNAAGSPQSVALTGAGTDFSIGTASGGSSTATVTAGQSASYALNVNAMNGFTGSATVSCTGAPAQAACTVPGTVSVSGASTSLSVSVTTTAAAMLIPEGPGSPLPPRMWLMLVVLVLSLVVATRLAMARVPRRAWVVAFSVVLMSMSALVF